MGSILVAALSAEGKAARVYGHAEAGRWVFWQEGSELEAGDDGAEDWRYWTDPVVTDLAAALPGDWAHYYPVAVHAAFRDWFRAAYQQARAGLDPGRRALHDRWRHADWRRALGGGVEPF
jgi:hypothetical protein